MSESRKYKLIKEYKDCVIIQNQTTGYFIVKERFDGDAIFMSLDLEKAEEAAKTYSFADVVKIRYEKFAEYLKRVTY